ncbi:MAG TPA: oligosaccharide flippase family protein, partial [Minicystis sp.]|nr:oligosaccharide flippase family protein [Minicystis sp.]
MQTFGAGVQAAPPSSRARQAIGRKAVHGALWTISTSVGARAVGLVGTLALTRFLAPDVYGEVSIAAVVIQTAQMASTCGLSQYVVSKPRAGQKAVFHATFYFLVLGFAALGLVVLLRNVLGPVFDAPGMARYIPGLAAAGVIERLATVQDRIQVRDMHFGVVGINRSLGEFTYAGVTVALAAAGFGGEAVVLGTLARSVVRLGFLTATTDRRAWLSPCRITWARTKELFSFGLPMSMAAFMGFGSRRWDNLVFASLFGPGPAGIYNLAYNLADIPATQIGETIGDVLVPSFAQMRPEDRRPALVRAMTLLVLLVAPLAIGLGAIAPTLVSTFFDARWAAVAPMLLVLSALSVVRPIGWIGSSYLQVHDRTRAIMVLEIVKTACLLGLIATLGRLGPLWACASVGIAFGASAVAYLVVIRRVDGTPLRKALAPLV